jgi:Bacterial regulatory proteins, gntR family
MNAGATAERVYDAVRRELRAGSRLDPIALASLLASSATPVREALCMLCGEGLVEARPGGGFHVPLIDAPALADLYAWNQSVIFVILGQIRGGLVQALDAQSCAAENYAAKTASFIERLARTSRNEEHVRAVRAISARLNPARLVEAELIENVDDELARLTEAARDGNILLLRAEFRRYHRRRVQATAEIVRRLLRE